MSIHTNISNISNDTIGNTSPAIVTAALDNSPVCDEEYAWGLEMALEIQRENRIFGDHSGRRTGSSRKSRSHSCSDHGHGTISAHDLEVMTEMAADAAREHDLLVAAHPDPEDQLLHRFGECDGSCLRFRVFRQQ